MNAPSPVAPRLLALAALVAALLSGCSPAAPAGQNLASPPPTAAPQAEEPAVSTQAPAAPAPTSLPEPVATSLPEPVATSLPEPTPTSPPEPTVTAAPQPTAGTPGLGAEILFLRGGVLTAIDVATRAERPIVEDVRDFSATPDGSQLALVRGHGASAELWTIGRDGAGLRRLTSNNRAEATPSWAPDGLSLAYASSPVDSDYRPEWQAWAAWCAASEVRLLPVLPGGARAEETTLAQGCDPAFSPDGRRIAAAAPPTQPEPGFDERAPLAINSIRLVNRRGENGWDFAVAERGDDTAADGGLLVYAPAWSPDGAQLIYHRFIGNRVETDVNISEIGGSFEGKGAPLGEGAGWLLPARFSPDGRSLVITEHNYGDARGFGGYDSWSASVLRLDGSREVMLPFGSLTMQSTMVGSEPLPRAQRAAWSPDGTALAVELPPGWRPGLSDAEPLDPSGAERPGEIWRWAPGGQPQERLVEQVDFASPLAWLPPASR